MKVTIYLKSEDSWQPTIFYEFAQEEYQRLMNEYQCYIKTGEPKMGVYYRDNRNPDHTNSVILNFEYVAVIQAEE